MAEKGLCFPRDRKKFLAVARGVRYTEKDKQRPRGKELANETSCDWYIGPCGLWQNHLERGHALPGRSAAKVGTGGPSGCLFGYRCPGARPGHHHLFQAGCAAAAGGPADLFGYPWPRGLFRGSGAGPAGDGLRDFGDQRHRRCAKPHRDLVAPVGTVSRAGVFVSE